MIGRLYKMHGFFIPQFPKLIRFQVSKACPCFLSFLNNIFFHYCGSGMFIPDSTFSIADPGSEFFHRGSRIQGQKDSGSRIRIHIKEFNYFEPKNCT
jgi:hypothetical protein